MSKTPALSVILATDRFETIRRVVDHLHAQSARARIELVIVATATSQEELAAPELEDFAAVRLVQIEAIIPIGMARAAGVRAATAPHVFLGETHTYPEPGWAQALIDAQGEDWAVIVPEIENANPTGALSWAGFLLDYGRWHDGRRRELVVPPAYNASVRRDVLVPRGRGLPDLLEPGGDLAGVLRAEGHRFLFEPAARISHLNVSMPTHWLRERYVSGRAVAARRSASWSWPRRVVHCVGAPLVPPLLLYRLRRHVGAAGRRRKLPRLSYPALALGAAACAVGELAGYVGGVGGRAQRALIEYELHKTAYVSER